MSNDLNDKLGKLAVRDLVLMIGGRARINHFTHTFRAGELWCIVGPNGAGKTTLIHTLAGVRAPEQGRVELDGRVLSDWPPAQLARRRALMPQTIHDVFHASVSETVRLSRYPHRAGWGWDNKKDHDCVYAALTQFDLTHLANRDVTTLSGGERQRVALAAALCQDAPLLLLDEPLTHLDIPHQVACLQRLRRWVNAAAHSQPRTVIFSCHDLNLARRFATHALLLDGKGAVRQGLARDALMPAPLSQTFHYPFTLLRDNGYAALLPAIPFDSAQENGFEVED